MTNNLGFRIPVRIKENGEGKHSESIVSESQNEITSQHELDNFRIKEAQEEVKRVSCWLKIFGQSYLGSIEVDWGSIADLSSPENIIKALDQANRGGSGSGKTGTVSLSEARCLGLPRRARGEIWAALLQVESLKVFLKLDQLSKHFFTTARVVFSSRLAMLKISTLRLQKMKCRDFLCVSVSAVIWSGKSSLMSSELSQVQVQYRNELRI